MNSKARRDSGKFVNINNKIYRDAGHSLGEDDSTFGDSGYTSVHHGHSHIECKHTTLQTIEESVEYEAVMTPSNSKNEKKNTPEVITPTSQNIQKIMALHLTTPPEQEPPKPVVNVMEMSPVKHAAELFEPKTPPELLISAHEILTANSTPRKPKMISRKRSMRDDTDSENNGKRVCLSKEEPGVCRMPFSPIQNRRILKERSVSDNNLLIRCSTPKEAMIRRRFFAETKTEAFEVPKTPEKSPNTKARQSLRRFQSFSPGKLKLQKQKPDPFHPYKKLSDAPSTSKQSPHVQSILKNIPEEVNELQSPEAIRHAKPAQASIILAETSAFDSFNFSHIVGKSISPIKGNLEHLLHSKILPDPEPANVTLELSGSFSFETEGNSGSLDEPKSPTPPTPPSMSSSLTKTRSPSASKRHLPLFRDLPNTPPKDQKDRRGLHGRVTPVKKSLFQNRTEFFDDRRHIDILWRLQSAPRIIEQVFQHLDDEDVLRAYAVSNQWKQLISENKTLNKRRLEYIKHSKKPNKENLSVYSPEPKPQYSRMPFATHNYDTRSVARANSIANYSPPVSPNKSRFRDNQKIIRKLSPRAMTTCPRCAKPSPIITQKVHDRIFKIGRSTRSSAKKAELRKTVSDTSAVKRHTLQDDSLIFPLESSSSDCSGGSAGSDRKIRRTLFPSTFCKTDKRSSVDTISLSSSNRSSLSVYSTYSIDGSPQSNLSRNLSQDGVALEEYGLCSGKSCGFKFCVKCLAEYHPGSVCRNSMELFSPGREEDSMQNRSNRACSRQSRRTLRRLCT